ncbi:DUF5658 family protein [Haloarculaceae archaeon H-GB2-1]|nr:hypothetical protein [Haloarculaceae archaeon H-GB1-1]MEA5387545.1 DUF5658 family protein [Haloarculaceae archaeon H-GB11]MEA5409027.1 DUF5658 family protein [Haloarculaceae archaeon H-GB2-1]
MSGNDDSSEAASTSEPRPSRFLVFLADAEHVLWLVVLVSLTLDVYLTFQGLKYGLSEWNPVMKYAMEVAGFPVLGLSKVLILGTAGLLRAARPELGALIPLAVGVPWVATVFVNLVMLGGPP